MKMVYDSVRTVQSKKCTTWADRGISARPHTEASSASVPMLINTKPMDPGEEAILEWHFPEKMPPASRATKCTYNAFGMLQKAQHKQTRNNIKAGSEPC